MKRTTLTVSLAIAFLAVCQSATFGQTEKSDSDDETPKQTTTISKSSNNVVLGRELIAVTKTLEEAARLQKQVLSLREAVVDSYSYRRSNLGTIEARIQQLKQSATSRTAAIKDLTEKLSGLQSEMSALRDLPIEESTAPSASHVDPSAAVSQRNSTYTVAIQIDTPDAPASEPAAEPDADAPGAVKGDTPEPGLASEALPQAVDGPASKGQSANPSTTVPGRTLQTADLGRLEARTSATQSQIGRLTRGLEQDADSLREIERYDISNYADEQDNRRRNIQSLGSQLDSINRLVPRLAIVSPR